jgi:transposase
VPATPRPLDWLAGFGTVALAGIEGTGSYGAGLARHVATAGVRAVEVGRSDRQDRRRQGKSDPLDAVSAARAAQPGRARGAPKGRDGAVEAIRALMVARCSAAGERTRAINQARALLLTGPDDLRARFARHTPAALVAGIASLRPHPGDVTGYAVRIALRELGRRAEFLDRQLECLHVEPTAGLLGCGHRKGASDNRALTRRSVFTEATIGCEALAAQI